MADYRYFKDDDGFVIEQWNGTHWEYVGSVDSEDVAIDICKYPHTLLELREIALDMGFSFSFVDKFIDSVHSHSGFVSEHEYRDCVDYLMQSLDGL